MFGMIMEHKGIAALVLLVLIGVAWYEFSSPPAPSSLLTTTSTTGASGPDQQLVSTLLTLRTVTLTGTILSDPAFRSLKDFSTQIVPTDVGRADPFAPTAGTSGVQVPATPASKNTRLFAPKN